MSLAILVSGKGTILEAILESGITPEIVIADRECRAIRVAESSGINAKLLRRNSFGPEFDREAYCVELERCLKASNVQVVVLAGFGTILTPSFIHKFEGRILNTHPSLLPAFKGFHAVRDALSYGVKVTGTTVHVVTENLDEGKILAQEPVEVCEGDTEETLHERIKEVERRLYPKVIRDFIASLNLVRKELRLKALISVYKKDNLEFLAKELIALGFELISSGGTYDFLSSKGLNASRVEDITNSKEILGGRVKTLHPKIYGAILADLNNPEHLRDLKENAIEPVSLVVCNLYPFTENPSIELIDIGGPTMVRAAAKNFEHVAVLVDPNDYEWFLKELKINGGTLGYETRKKLAAKAFSHIEDYDREIARYFRDDRDDEILPQVIDLKLYRTNDELRYGENPHQRGARYKSAFSSGWIDSMNQHSGKALSYLNLYDADCAWHLAHEMKNLDSDLKATVIVKHANPCGAALMATEILSYEKALEGDPISAFGGVIAIASNIREDLAKKIAEGPQADVIVAYSYTQEALSVLKKRRKATRLISAPPPVGRVVDFRTLDSSYLVQESDIVNLNRETFKVVTESEPSYLEFKDLDLAYLICARTTSNAITIVKDQALVGVGAGQQSRVDAAKIAVQKAGKRAKGAAGASDAFFPFEDALECLVDAGVSCVIEPGGSINDENIIAYARSRGISLVFTGQRHFRH